MLPYSGVLPPGMDRVAAPPQDNRYTFPDNEHTALSGLAVHNGLLGASLPKMNQILWVDAVARKILGPVAMDDPRGLLFDSEGRLLVLSGRRLLRYTLGPNPLELPTPTVLVDSGLEDPQQIASDAAGNLYISDRGRSNQVKVFTADGKPLRTIGQASDAMEMGPYNPLKMRNPNGLTISDDGNLWGGRRR